MRPRVSAVLLRRLRQSPTLVWAPLRLLPLVVNTAYLAVLHGTITPTGTVALTGANRLNRGWRLDQIARVSSAKAAESRCPGSTPRPSSWWPRRRFWTKACPALITRAERSRLRPRVGRSRDLRRP